MNCWRPSRSKAWGGLGFNLGAPVLNECGQVVGVLSNNFEMAVNPAQLQQIFSSESWVPPRASQQCLDQEQADSLAEAVQDSLAEAVQDSLAQVVQAAQDSMTAMAARLRALETRPVQDQNPEEIQGLQEEIQRQQEEIQRHRELIESLSAAAQPEPQPRVPRWAIVMGLSILAALGLAGVVRLRSGAGSRGSCRRAPAIPAATAFTSAGCPRPPRCSVGLPERE